jgi:hypothetical protein
VPRLFVIGFGLLVPLFILSGCGSSKSSSNGVVSKSANQIVQEAQTAAEAAKSVRLSGSIRSPNLSIRLDLQLLAGKGATGRMSENGLPFQLTRIGSDVYIKGSEAFYSHFAGAEAAKLLKGKWLKMPATSPDFESIVSFTDLGKFFSGVLSSHGKLAKGKTTTIAGQKVIALKDMTKGGTLYVATTGKPYPIELSSPGGSSGAITFDRWNESVKLSTPANAVDVSKLK